jgi:glycosyltransferase involved in cell wall biosynthesis
MEVKSVAIDKTTGDHQRLRVFVHLARAFGRTAWKQRWEKGEIVGINHDDPYGYRQAEQMGCIVEQSEDIPEGPIKRLLRLGVRVLLGFDFVHAWSNRKGILAADVVWTHTESQALAVLMLMRLYNSPGHRPAVIAQTIWVMDSWETYSALRRSIYCGLLRHADTLTFHSLSATDKAKKLFPATPIELVKYGIRADQPLETIERPTHLPIHILSMGTDRHRDWPTLIQAVQNHARYEAKVATRAKIDDLLALAKNVARVRATNNDQLMELMQWADLVVVPLVDNLHASGITVIEEAVLCGIPVIATDAGGLRSYFSADEITYVPVNDSQALRFAIDHLMADDDLRQGKARRALERMKSGDLNSRSFVARHVEISNSILQSREAEHSSERLAVLTGR